MQAGGAAIAIGGTGQDKIEAALDTLQNIKFSDIIKKSKREKIKPKNKAN